MKRFKAMCLVAATALAGVAAMGRSAAAAVFDEVPSDAIAVFEVRNIDQLNTKWNKFADATGLSALSAKAKDPVNQLENQMGLTQGINSAGDLAVVLFQTGNKTPRAIVLFPVSDYKAFIGNFRSPQEDADGITAATATDGRHLQIAHWGDYAAVTRFGKTLLAQKPQGIKLDGIAADALKSKDAILWFNMDQIRTTELPKLKENRQAIIDRMATSRPSPNPVMAKIGWTLLLNQAEEFLQDAKTGVVTLNVTDDGIAITGVSDFLPDSADSRLAAAMKGTDQPLLTGLPDKKYLMLFGEMLSPELKQQISANWLDPLIKQLDTGDASNKPHLDALAAGKAKLAAMDATAAGVVSPAGNPGQDPMLQVVGAMTGDGPAWKKAQLAGLQAIGDMSKNADPAAPATMTVDTKSDAATVADVHLDQFNFKIDFNGNGAQAAPARQATSMLFGPNGITGYIGAASDKAGVFTMDIDDQSVLLADAIAAAKSGKDVVSSSKTVQDVAAKLPSPRVAEGFVYVDQMVGLGVRIAQSFGLGVRLDLPADVDPIGFALSGNGQTIQGDVFIPQSLVKSIVGAVNGLRGGGGGGGGDTTQPLPGGQGQ